MAKGGAFNVSKLIDELGLKTISGETLRILETVQPVLNVGDLEGVTPPHVPASALISATEAAAGGLAATVQVQCLAAGGAIVEWVIPHGAIPPAMFLRGAGVAGLAPLAVQQISRDPIVSIASSGDGVALSGGVPLDPTVFYNFGPNGIFVPTGSFFILQAVVVNFTSGGGLKWREVPAAENL